MISHSVAQVSLKVWIPLHQPSQLLDYRCLSLRLARKVSKHTGKAQSINMRMLDALVSTTEQLNSRWLGVS